MKKLIPFFLTLVLAACTANPGKGVSYELACQRRADISDVRYNLTFDIPEQRDSAIPASIEICFKLRRKEDVVLDFRQKADSPEEHIVIPRKELRRGENSYRMDFTAGEQSLNRRDRFLYTLLVPDRARTLFPCFDQPDMKAVYSLTLNIPENWTAVSNTYAESTTARDGRKCVKFAPTEPLSTYLFSFVAGKFQCDSIVRNGQPIHIYHRETDPAKIAQCGDILGIVCSSLDYLEEYTSIPYPFAKYDCIAIPDFQYGGMEHTGATLYNDRKLFLNPNPTTDELLDRANLIAHETAHMWFGDLVTMKWFNDVWTKEVFANWFAAKMVRPLYPEINHQLGDMKYYYASSYSEDRTPGSNAIQRPLDNLDNAGLIYCNIIYDKAPVVMEMLAKRLGYDKFREGIRDYLKTFAYGNASWDDLIDILSPYADFDLAEWSRVWIKEKGMPVFRSEIAGRTMTVTQSDPFGAGNLWQEPVEFTLIGSNGEIQAAEMDFTSPVQSVSVPFEIAHAIPNSDGLAYGCFVIDEDGAGYLKDAFSSIESAECRMSVLMTLYENCLRGNTSAGPFIDWSVRELTEEKDNLIRSSLLSYGADLYWKCGGTDTYPEWLKEIAANTALDHELRLMAFRILFRTATGSTLCAEMYNIWAQQKPYSGLSLGENDWTAMAYQLMVRYPEKAALIKAAQLLRIMNPDRRETFEFVSRACSESREERDELFAYLLTEEGRSNESRASSALAFLNHPLRQDYSMKYIVPALGIIEDVQRQGDIFFPQTWCSSLLDAHNSTEAVKTVEAFMQEHESLNPLLAVKILQNIPTPLKR